MARRTTYSSPTYTTPVGEVARVLGWMPQVIRSAGLTDWERQFCASMIVRHRRSPAFTPTDKQVGIMAKLVLQVQKAAFSEDTITTEEACATPRGT